MEQSRNDLLNRRNLLLKYCLTIYSITHSHRLARASTYMYGIVVSHYDMRTYTHI